MILTVSNSAALKDYYRQLKEKIESMRWKTGLKVLLVAHSYGNLILAHFLHSMEPVCGYNLRVLRVGLRNQK